MLWLIISLYWHVSLQQFNIDIIYLRLEITEKAMDNWIWFIKLSILSTSTTPFETIDWNLSSMKTWRLRHLASFFDRTRNIKHLLSHIINRSYLTSKRAPFCIFFFLSCLLRFVLISHLSPYLTIPDQMFWLNFGNILNNLDVIINTQILSVLLFSVVIRMKQEKRRNSNKI